MKIITLYAKLIIGYILLFVIISCFVGIIYNERLQKQQIENTMSEIRSLRRLVNTAHRQIAELSLLGESVAGWEDPDYALYQGKTAVLDSILRSAEPLCKEFVSYDEIDSLRSMFSEKEQFMYRLMRVFREVDRAEKRPSRQYSAPKREAISAKAEPKRKSWLFGLIKGKEKETVNPSSDQPHPSDGPLAGQQMERNGRLVGYIDSLQQQNVELNRRMTALISGLDIKMQRAIQSRETDIQNLHDFSFILIACGIGCAVLLLAFLFIVTYRDRIQHLSSNRMLEDALKQNSLLADTQRKILLAVSHDIRGPLGAILNSAELAMDTREKRKRNIHLENIQSTCRHILRMVNDLLDVYRIGKGKDVVNTVPFRLEALLGKIAETYTHRSNLAGLAFNYECEGTDVTVSGDPDRLERVLDNLLSNAVKFTRHGSVSLAASYKENCLSLTVQDSGIGMSGETLSEVFEPLVRAALDMDAGGFGLGLPIVRGLVKNMSGELKVESRVGKGTAFHVTLPLPETDETIQSMKMPSAPSAFLPKKVIAIDDDRMQLAIIKEMLERNGIACRACNHVREVTTALREDGHDLVLTDIQMAGTDGFALLSLLRSSNIGNSKEIPVAAMTARGDDRMEEYLKAGFSGCILKPFSMKELLAFLASLMPKGEGHAGIDFSGLVEHVDNKEEVLRLFISETTRDIGELEEAQEHGDRAAMRGIVHRMLPTWTLLQCENPLYAYQNNLHDERIDVETLKGETQRIITQMKGFITEAGQEMTRLEHEEENTDC